MKALFSRRGVRVALVALIVVVWIASGVLLRDPPEAPQRTDPGPMQVAVEVREATPVERILVLQGRVEPDQRVIVRAETAGQIEAWLVRRGGAVEEGEEIARISLDEREARRRQALARVRDRQSEYEAVRNLVKEGFAAPREERVALADLEAARAGLEEIEQEIENTRIRSPLRGVLNQRIAELGEFVAVGGDVGEIVDNDPLRVVGQIPQHQIGRVHVGIIGRVRFIDGTTAEGEITYLSSVADQATRTFRVEVEIPNPDQTLPSGISAELILPTATVQAHKLSPALLTLDDEGRVGAMSVDEEDRVDFHPVEVVRAEPDGIWVLGLPDRVRLITIGQGFVTAGDKVLPRDESGEARLGGGEPP
jgi:membrane fusion protein, multidrug efflux system